MVGETIVIPENARELLHRVAASAQFQKSKRLRDLLLYVGEWSLRDPQHILREQEIGVDVLGRQPDYDTSHDTLVRVQVSQLRKKLQEYFAGEGRDEPLIIEIPKGSYVPVFRHRSAKTEPHEAEHEEVGSGARSRLWWQMALPLAASLVLLALVIWLGLSRSRPERTLANGPTVEAFWRQCFGNGQPTNLIMSDIGLIEFQKTIGQPMQLTDYEIKDFDRIAKLYVKDTARRELVMEVVHRVSTSVSDVQVARDLGLIAFHEHTPLAILSARDASTQLVSSENAILLGSRRADPWVGLFEEQLNFRTEYQENPPAARFVNTSPREGEEPSYGAQWRQYGYCRVAFLPNPRKSGNVLLISGTDVISSEAGGRYVASEDSLHKLRDSLGLKAGDPFPYFEVLLKTRVVNNNIPWFEVVAYRPRKK